MSRIGSLLVKLLVFVVAAGLSYVVATAVMAATEDRTPASTVGMAPEYLLAGTDTPAGADMPAGPGPVVAFNEEPSGEPIPLATLAPQDLDAAAAALLGGGNTATTTAIINPSGFPRIPPITQFDGGPKQGSNCTLASGAMLARLGHGVVTSGSLLRTLQDDQDGGTDLNDLDQALWRGYGINYPRGMIRPAALKELLGKGYGAVIQGIYGEIPASLRLQRNFTGGHAIYLDGYYPGNAQRGIPEAYYVIDPIGRPKSGYEGDWWPASVVDRFALAFGGSRVVAMWAYPPGGTPPAISNPDVLPIPSGGGGPSGPSGPAAGSPEPGASASEVPPPSTPPVAEPGDVTAVLGEPPVMPVDDASDGGFHMIPLFDLCVITPKPPGCPTGLKATFDRAMSPTLQLRAGPEVNVLFVDSDRSNVAMVGFTVDPAVTADVKFWEEGVSPSTVHHASSMTTIDLLGKPVTLARLDVKANTTYRFQVVAGDGLTGGVSEAGTFTTGSGVELFDVALAKVTSPLVQLEAGLSPYLHPAAGAFARPLVRLQDLGGTCASRADFGGTAYCLDLGRVAPPPSECATVNVAWTLSGIDADEVLVRAFPVETGVTPDGSMTLEGVIEVSGAAPSGTAAVGCLASGLSYTIAIDAVGDDRGFLATKTIAVP